MTIKENLRQHGLRPGPRSAERPRSRWLKAHDNRFGLFIDGAWTKPGTRPSPPDNPATGRPSSPDITEATARRCR